MVSALVLSVLSQGGRLGLVRAPCTLGTPRSGTEGCPRTIVCFVPTASLGARGLHGRVATLL
eukprot:1160908-Pelagomonas_calceolata.AAC.7